VELMSRETSIDVGEIESVYRARVGSLRRVARAITGDSEAARDVVQDAFASAISGRVSYRPMGSLDAWIWRIVVNRAISERRRLSRATTPPLAHEPSLDGDAGDGGGPLAAAVALLPERQRLAVFLRYFADLEYAAIAEVLGVSPGTVGASLHAAREALRAALEAERACT
jgi:RNA polymerase sigma-70 factor, ECF subfamily